MKIELKKDFTWSLIVPSSMGVRITPANGQPVHCSDTFHMQVTSAETNVASVPSYLGLPVKVLTTFVKDSPIARMIKDNLSGRHMAYEGVELNREDHGDFVISSILPTAVMDHAGQEYRTTVRVKWVEHSVLRISTLRDCLMMKAFRSFIYRDL